MGWLEGHCDPGMDLGEAATAWDPEAYAQKVTEEVIAEAAKLYVASVMPRRLGGQATRNELAADKRLARRLGWVMNQAVLAWGGSGYLDKIRVESQSEEARVSGAQVDLQTWHEERSAKVRRERQFVASVCLHHGLRQLGNRFVQRYTSELGQIRWALR
jgi:hypothetical protein